MPKEFDFSAAVKELAEAEWVRKSVPDFVGNVSAGMVETLSMEVPFASLRVECGQIHHLACKEYMSIRNASCTEVSCPGWVPEPDVRVACWEIMEHHPEIVLALYKSGRWLHEGYDVKEAVIRAALAWVRDKRA